METVVTIIIVAIAGAIYEKFTKKTRKRSSNSKKTNDADWIYYEAWDKKTNSLVQKRTKKKPDEYKYEFVDVYDEGQYRGQKRKLKSEYYDY